MISTLSGIRTLTLGRRELRQLVNDRFSDGQVKSRPSDRSVLDLVQRGSDEKGSPQIVRETLSLERLLASAASACGIDFDLSRDLEAGPNGHLQVSEAFWRRVVFSFARLPWAFICNYAENEASAVHNDVHGISYGFHEDVTSWRGIVAAGANSYILFYNTVNAPSSTRHYTALARVTEIEEIRNNESGGRRAWRAHLADFHSFTPVHADAIPIDGRNNQHGIQAITWETLLRVLELGESESPLVQSRGENQAGGATSPRIKPTRDEVLMRGPANVDLTPSESVAEERPLVPYRDPGEELSGDLRRRPSRNPSRDKVVELNAVAVATTYLNALGWNVRNDCQRDGVGYDFEFEKDGHLVLVEIKGIGGDRLEFNMTAKEWHVCSSDSRFVLIAVTNALDSDKYQVHILTKKELFQFKRQATQFRLASD
jgi:hypothetical protein